MVLDDNKVADLKVISSVVSIVHSHSMGAGAHRTTRWFKYDRD